MGGSGATRVALATLGLWTSTACVSQQQYDDMHTLWKRDQMALHEKEGDLARMQAEMDALRRGRALTEVSQLQDAGFGDDLQSRLSELQQKIDGLGRPLRDIERIEVEGGYVLMVQDKILFDSGSSELSADGKTQLATVAAEIQGRPHGRIWVRGHTDNVPVSKPQTKERFPHGNIQLSAARAVEVAAALTGTGKVPARDVVVVGFGQHDPLHPNDSADNKRLNRRVEIFVSDQAATARPAATDKPQAEKAGK